MNLDLEASAQPSRLLSSEETQYLGPSQNNSDSESSPQHSYAANKPLHLHIRTVTGWDRSCIELLLQSITALLWGIALCLFAMGKVPVTWSLSQLGANHQNIISFLVTIVATLTTTHAKQLITMMINQAAKICLLNNFTLSQLAWMQGVREWDIFARFPTRTRAFWVLLWVGMNVHTASVASIMRPVDYAQYVPYPDTVPCGVPSDNLTLNPMVSLSPPDKTHLEQSALAIGLQLGTYYTALQWNTTTTVFSRPYVKGNISFGVIGGLRNGLQDVSGVLFDVRCATDRDGQGALNSTWARTFPNRSFPLVQVDTYVANASISGSFVDPPVNTSLMQSVTSSTTFNLTASDMALYSLVNADGSGGLLGVTADPSTIVCTWHAVPKLVHAILVSWIANSYSIENATTAPEYVGYGVLATIRGMAYAAALTGARLDRDRAIGPLKPPPNFPVPSTAEMLGALLADGVRSTLTGFTAMSKHLVPQCHANVRTITIHWRFGNENNLGWVAIIITIGVGIAGIVGIGIVMCFFGRVKRMTGFEALDPGMVFMLGLDSDIFQLPDGQIKDTALKIQDGRVIVR